MTDMTTLTAIAVIFLLAGSVKGMIGLGLPSVSLALLTIILDLPAAMALMLVPALVTNLWQAGTGGNGLAILRRLWPFLLAVAATIWLGVVALTRVDLALLSALLGVLLVIYTVVSLAGFRLSLSRDQERWAGPLCGLVNGVLTGMTGSSVVPGVMFLQAIGLPRDMLVQAMGVLFALSTLVLGLALGRSQVLTADLGLVSVAAVIPSILGMILGQRMRNGLPEAVFRQVFFVSLLVLGVYITVRAYGAYGG